MKTPALPLAAVLLLPACGANRTVAVRPLPTALAAGAHPASFRIAEANGHLALGNVALALEGFRRALREDPENAASLVGMANCYDLMGRNDLSRSAFEKALALQPRDQTILAAFAQSLTRAGATQEAAQVRREGTLQAGKAAAPGPSLAESILAASKAGASLLSAGGVSFAASHAPLAQRHSPRGAAYLERTALGETLLVTGKAPHWKPLPVMAAKGSAMPAKPSSRMAAAPVVKLTIHNAGSTDGAAARARLYLQKLGWSKIAIANGTHALERTELLYPAALAKAGERLARQLRIPVVTRQTETLDRIVLRLGRDAASAKRS
ncbi:LytR C-terminal domain-containing protein [Sphingomonas kaistensis]|uniref:LytR C-terminal domain-containing protein n=1 Tax=Sphingomonas kaistensis TaxID=298708 RepID=A0ABZ2G254_9SPHN